MTLKMFFRLFNSLFKILVTLKIIDAYTLKVKVDLKLGTLSGPMDSNLLKCNFVTPWMFNKYKIFIQPLQYRVWDLCIVSASVSYLCPRTCQMYLPCLLLSFDSSWKFDHVSKIIQFDHIISILFLCNSLEREK